MIKLQIGVYSNTHKWLLYQQISSKVSISIMVLVPRLAQEVLFGSFKGTWHCIARIAPLQN